VVLSFPKKELILPSVVRFSLFQRKNSSSQVLLLRSSLFFKERTFGLDSVVQFSRFQRKNSSSQCCAVLSFSKKGRVSKGQVYLSIKRGAEENGGNGFLYVP
jgi:hypothetical protein